MEKLIKNSKNKNDGKCFVKINGNKETGIAVRFNVFASDLIGKQAKKANVLFEGRKVFVIPDKNGDYALTKSQNAYRMSIQSLLNHIGEVDFSKRYDVEKCENGIMFCLD